jgi:hypothetical protein
LQLAPNPVEVVRRGLSRSRHLVFGDRGMDRAMFHQGALHASGLWKQRPPHSFEMGANGIKHLVDANKVETVGQLAVEPRVEFMKTLDVAAIQRCTLVGEILGELLDRAFRHITCAATTSISRARRISIHCFTSDSRIFPTNEPRCDSMTTNPSNASRLIALVIDNRETPKRALHACLSIGVWGASVKRQHFAVPEMSQTVPPAEA